MVLRINIQNERVQEILNKIDSNKRKYFVEEAILNYEQHLRTDRNAVSIFLNVKKETENKKNKYIDFDDDKYFDKYFNDDL